ncbi:MAG: 2Fe-2S iron-sulfur cluster-binding protein [Limisphaerales bacterium]
MIPIPITIDGKPVDVDEGGTILDGARRLGIDIPTLCYLERCGPMTSCLACVVKLKFNGRTSIVPSCGMRAMPGMVVESETPEVHELRRSALELLLSDHVGDCLSPCARICPLGLNIPQMLRQVQAGRLEEAATTVRSALALPAVLGRLCHRPCENGCRRAACDSAAAIRDVERFVADTEQGRAEPRLPRCAPGTGRRVAIIGAGPTGLAAAYELVRHGHRCVVWDRAQAPGGSLRREVDDGRLGGGVLDIEIRELRRLGIEFCSGMELGRDVRIPSLLEEFDAVLLAMGGAAIASGPGLGVEMTAAGVKIVRADAFLTSVDGVFAAGSAVRPVKQLVKAMAEGQMAAEAIGEFLAGHDPRKAPKPFSSVMGRLEKTELRLFQAGASPDSRVVACGGAGAGLATDEAARESARCLHCDCRAAGNCRLQHYSQVYGAEFGRFPRQRRLFEQHHHPARVLFEPGKCILCGICVKIASDAAEPLGLTFVGRGFDVRVSAPWNEAFEAGLRRTAADCAEACPTGAIVVDESAAPTTAEAPGTERF